MGTREDTMELLLRATKMERPSKDSTARLAQASATLYVGEQLERIADMLAGGFTTERDDYGRYGAYPANRR